jgi:EF hand domain-containing protein
MNTSAVRGFAAAALALFTACALPVAAAHDDSPGCQRPQVTTREAEGTGDGGITAANHAATASKRFEMMDTNKDGKISAAEISASHGAESIVWANHPESNADKIRSLDTNRDGVLTVSEYTSGSQRMFEELDVDGNGVLTPSEMMIDPRSR